jgi:hypothetical protein
VGLGRGSVSPGRHARPDQTRAAKMLAALLDRLWAAPAAAPLPPPAQAPAPEAIRAARRLPSYQISESQRLARLFGDPHPFARRRSDVETVSPAPARTDRHQLAPRSSSGNPPAG